MEIIKRQFRKINMNIYNPKLTVINVKKFLYSNVPNDCLSQHRIDKPFKTNMINKNKKIK